MALARILLAGARPERPARIEAALDRARELVDAAGPRPSEPLIDAERAELARVAA